MKLRLLILTVFTVGLSMQMSAQLNKYKYIIVPKQFDAFKSPNRHQTSTIIKHLFTKNGFNVVYDDALPVDLANNRCLGLLADLEDNSSLFATKVVIVLKDCQLNEIFRSIEGRSKIKEFRTAYREAVNESFISFEEMNYVYTPSKDEQKKTTDQQPVTVSFKNDVKQLEEKPKEHVIVQEATPENQTYKSVEPKESSYVKTENAEVPSQKGLLYAQPIENGYQLVDSTPKVVMKLMKTSVENIFLVNHDGRNGMLTMQDGKWILEYADGGGKKPKELNIKF
ncbi:hypothetical protein [Flagellimonas sp. S3867]|uniref:hypothetical protein n=1 Tax=Flagellimonas sp. S3867 TaxID=2768063 RepID=UPI001686B1EA|nr:hypothetical protein [Flagellimonas sp. S3867]